MCVGRTYKCKTLLGCGNGAAVAASPSAVNSIALIAPVALAELALLLMLLVLIFSRLKWLAMMVCSDSLHREGLV